MKLRTAGIRDALVIALGLSILGCESGDSPSPKQLRSDASLVEIIGQPDKFDGLTISTFGFLVSPGGSTALFLTKDHANHTDAWSSIAIGEMPVSGKALIGESPCLGKYVHLTGRIQLRPNAPAFMDGVEMIVDSSTGLTCWSANSSGRE